MTEIAFATDFIVDRTAHGPHRPTPGSFVTVPSDTPASEPGAVPRRASGWRAAVESAVGTAFSAAVAVAMVTGLAGVGTASVVVGAASALRAR